MGAKNPYLYRGYRSDSETGLYYLQSRYYNPDWGRFINPDAEGGKVGELLSHNVFAYALNNPVNMEDPSGFLPTWAKWAIGAVAVAATIAVVAVVAPAVVPFIVNTVINVGTRIAAGIAATTVAATRVAQRAGPAVTGASNPGYSGSAGSGLGKLANKALTVTEKGLNIVKNHVSGFGQFPENNAMISRLETAMSKGSKITESGC